MNISNSIIIAVEDELSGAVMSRLILYSGRNFTVNRASCKSVFKVLNV